MMAEACCSARLSSYACARPTALLAELETQLARRRRTRTPDVPRPQPLEHSLLGFSDRRHAYWETAGHAVLDSLLDRVTCWRILLVRRELVCAEGSC